MFQFGVKKEDTGLTEGHRLSHPASMRQSDLRPMPHERVQFSTQEEEKE